MNRLAKLETAKCRTRFCVGRPTSQVLYYIMSRMCFIILQTAIKILRGAQKNINKPITTWVREMKRKKTILKPISIVNERCWWQGVGVIWYLWFFLFRRTHKRATYDFVKNYWSDDSWGGKILLKWTSTLERLVHKFYDNSVYQKVTFLYSWFLKLLYSTQTISSVDAPGTLLS